MCLLLIIVLYCIMIMKINYWLNVGLIELFIGLTPLVYTILCI